MLNGVGVDLILGLEDADDDSGIVARVPDGAPGLPLPREPVEPADAIEGAAEGAERAEVAEATDGAAVSGGGVADTEVRALVFEPAEHPATAPVPSTLANATASNTTRRALAALFSGRPRFPWLSWHPPTPSSARNVLSPTRCRRVASIDIAPAVAGNPERTIPIKVPGRGGNRKSR